MTGVKQKKETREFVVSGWHLKKEVTIGQLITLIVLLISGLWWASSVETRIAELGSENKRIEEKTDIIINHMDAKFDVYQTDIERALGRIERKQDKIFDRLDGKMDKP